MFDTAMCYLSASPRWLSEYGFEGRDLKGLSHYDVFPEITSEWREAHRRGLAGEILNSDGDCFKRVDGSEQWIRWEIRPWHGVTGEIDGIIIFSEDITKQKQIEASLIKSEENFRAIFNNTDVGVLFTAPDGRIFTANNAACKMLERSEQELCHGGRHLVVDTTDPRLPHALEERRHTGRFQGELNYKRRDGTLFPVELSSTIFPYGNNESRSCIIFRDITNRKQAETVLHHKQAMLARTEKIAQVGSWEWNVATDTMEWSDELFRIFQLEPSERAPSFAEQSELYHPEDMVRLKTAIESALKNGTPYELELRIIRKNEATRVCLARGHVEADRNSRTTRLVGSLQNITERKENYQRVFENKMIAMCIFDPETLQIIEANGTFVHLYGYSLEELLDGMKLTELSAEKELSIESIRSAKFQNSFFVPRRYHKKKDGTIFCVEISGEQFMHNGRMVLLCMAHDISKRILAEEELLKAHGELERKVLERTTELEKTNATLAMMLDYARKTEADIQERVVSNLRSNILSILDMLRNEQLTENAKKIIEHMESTTRNLAHPLARNLESQLLKLTAREMQLANFIRLGKSTKDIMALLNVTSKTVEAHRTNLRKKLGIHRKKINLRTFLNSEFTL